MAALELFCSPPGTGKTTHCIELFAEKVSESKGGLDNRSFFILPSREHAERIRNQILKREIPGFFNAHLLTINDFAAYLLPGMRAPAPSDTVRRRILRELLQEDRKGLDYFEKVKDFPGFHEMLVDTIKEFKSGALDIESFEKRCQKLLKEPVFRAKFRSFTVLMKRYEKALSEARLEEPQDTLTKLLEAEISGDPIDLVVFDGFYHFTRAQRIFIAYLCRRAARVIVTLTLPANAEERSQVFDYPMQTRKFLLSLGFKESGIPAVNHRTADAALRHLEKNIFLKKPQIASGAGGNILLLQGESPRGEMELIAREIRRLYRESATHYSDMCVIFRKIGSYRQLVKSVFAEFDIPVIVHEREKLAEQGLGITLYRFLNLLDEDWVREDLVHVLKSSYLKDLIAPEAAVKLESAAFRTHVTGGWSHWERLLISGLDPEAAEALRKLKEWHASLLEADSARDFEQKLLNLIRSWDISAQEEALRAVEEVLKNCGRFYRKPQERSFSPSLFVKELKDALKSALFSLKPPGRNRVQVYDVVMAIPKEYKVVFLAGLLEKSFPQGVAEDPLFKDEERRQINGDDGALEERRRRATGERYFFYMGLSRARERLYLSYPKHDSEGKPTLVSFFVEEAKKCFERLPEVRKEAADIIPVWTEWESEQDIFLGLSRLLFEPRPADGAPWPLPEAVFQLLRSFKDRAAFKEVLRAGFSEEEALIRDPKIKRLFSRIEGPFSPTRLETFATCAFKYFADRVLGLREPQEKKEFRDMGDLLHKILERFYTEAAEAGTKDAFNRLSKMLEEEIARSPLSYLPLYRRKICEAVMSRALLLFAGNEKELSARRALTPKYFEYKFDGLKVGSPYEQILVKGVIDRIDVDPETQKALVIDYKLSKREVPIRQKLSEGMELQIPLYLLAARRILKLDVAGGELRFLRTAGSEGLYRESEKPLLGLSSRKAAYTEEEFEGMLHETEKRVSEYVKRLRSADIAVKSKSCKYCSFSPVCRFETWRSVYSDDE